MPEERETEFATPIPLRENGGNPVMPNPYTRLDAVAVVADRLKLLWKIGSEWRLVDPDADPTWFRTTLLGVLEELATELWDARHGSLEACERLLEAAPLELWASTVHGIIYPACAGQEPPADPAGRP